MKKSKEEKAAEKLAALLGMEAPTVPPKHQAMERSMEAEAALEYHENPRTFTHKKCKQCKRTFATRGAPVAYCNDSCRAQAFEDRMGVKWLPFRNPTDRWGFMGEPLVVPTEALQVVDEVLAQQEQQAQTVEEPEESPPLADDTLDILRSLGLD